MEFFVLLSFVGVIGLLTTHMVDYAAEVKRRRAWAARVSMPDADAPINEEPLPIDMVNQYDRAA